MSLTINYYDHKMVLLPEGGILLPDHHTLVLSNNTEHVAKNTREQDLFGDREVEILRTISQTFQVRHYIFIVEPKNQSLSINNLREVIGNNLDEQIILVGQFNQTVDYKHVYDSYSIGSLCIVNEANDTSNAPTLIGSIHPYVTVQISQSKQRYRCYYQIEKQLFLPAFGGENNGVDMSLGIADQAYAIRGKTIIPLKL